MCGIAFQCQTRLGMAVGPLGVTEGCHHRLGWAAHTLCYLCVCGQAEPESDAEMEPWVHAFQSAVQPAPAARHEGGFVRDGT